jgi:putative transferase (TIGR04331 family)
MCYLEGFENLNKKVNQERWPSKPKFIFSSNNFEYDEIFKLWAAKKMLEHIPLIFGQHGNDYGTDRYYFPYNEEMVCDKFITWGWASEIDQHIPAFIFRNAGKKFKNIDPMGKLLLIETHEENRFQTWDTSFEFLEYFKEQVVFADHLDLGPKENLVVRLALFSQQLFGFENERWKDYDSSIQLESGTLPITELISKSRLVVHSYDSTGMLETLSRNIPTLAFWQNNLEHLREGVLEDYQLLVDAGIIHLSPESAANKVNEIWNDVNGWWLNDSVQNARRQYCEKYARTSEHPIRDLKKILLNNSVKQKLKA